MKNKTFKTTALIAALALGAAFVAAPTFAHGPTGPGGQWQSGGYGMMGHMGNMGPGMMGHMGNMGPGMMGFGPGGQGDCPYGQKAAFSKDVTVDSVTKFLEQRLDMMGNKRLKVGDVKEKDDKTITGEIVTQDGSLVQKLQFDRETGRHRMIN